MNPGSDAEEIVKGLASNFGAIVRSMRNRFPELAISGVMGFSRTAWDRLFPGESVSRELETFQEIKGDKFTAPSTPGDLFFHLCAGRVGMFAFTKESMNAMYTIKEVSYVRRVIV